MTLCVVVVVVKQYQNFLVLSKSGALQSSTRNSFFFSTSHWASEYEKVLAHIYFFYINIHSVENKQKVHFIN